MPAFKPTIPSQARAAEPANDPRQTSLGAAGVSYPRRSSARGAQPTGRARLERRRPAHPLDLVDPFSLIDSILASRPVPAGIRISLDVESTPFLAARDPLETVLRQLIDNAIAHHDRPRGLVRIALEASGGGHLFTIMDDGPGLFRGVVENAQSSGEVARIDVVTDSEGGLALCARLVEAHGAKLELEIETGQRGTIARLWWPPFHRMMDG